MRRARSRAPFGPSSGPAASNGTSRRAAARSSVARFLPSSQSRPAVKTRDRRLGRLGAARPGAGRCGPRSAARQCRRLARSSAAKAARRRDERLGGAIARARAAPCARRSPAGAGRRAPPRHQVATQEWQTPTTGAAKARVGGKRRAVEMDDVGAARCAPARRRRAPASRDLARAAGGPVERQAGDRRCEVRGIATRLRERWSPRAPGRARRASSRRRARRARAARSSAYSRRRRPRRRSSAGAAACADQAHRHAASARTPRFSRQGLGGSEARGGRIAVALEPRSSASQRASAATPVRQGIGDRSSSARAARRVSET